MNYIQAAKRTARMRPSLICELFIHWILVSHFLWMCHWTLIVLSSGLVFVPNGGWLRQRRPCIRASVIHTCTASGWISCIGN